MIKLAEEGKLLDSDKESNEKVNNYFCNMVNTISSKNHSSV